THDTGLGAPQAVRARLAPGLAGSPADDDEEVTGEMVARPPGRRDTDSVTNELAAAPAADEFLFDEDVSSSTGLHVAFERPEEAGEAEEEPDEDDGVPRLTDDEPLAGMAGFHDLDAELALEPVEAVDEDLYRQFLQQARDAERRGDLAGAIVSYGDAIDLAPDRLEPLLGRGRAHLELGDYSAAMSDFQRAEDLAPGSAEPLVEMGNLYFARKEYRRAIEFYDQALELDGSLAMARCRRGICHHYRRNHRAAFQDLQKAYALDPDIPNIRKYVQMAVKAMERERRGR
ncbi:MAG: tetratricopeptide repeat protein, partial [Deltaproteobacteria bacterium]